MILLAESIEKTGENGKKKKCLVSIVNDVETFEDSSPPFLLNCSLAIIIIILLIAVNYLK